MNNQKKPLFMTRTAAVLSLFLSGLLESDFLLLPNLDFLDLFVDEEEEDLWLEDEEGLDDLVFRNAMVWMCCGWMKRKVSVKV